MADSWSQYCCRPEYQYWHQDCNAIPGGTGQNTLLDAALAGLSAEAASGILNLSFVWWLSELFVTGYRKPVGGQDLFDLDPGLESEQLGKRLGIA
jgi:hypothetical protein